MQDVVLLLLPMLLMGYLTLAAVYSIGHFITYLSVYTACILHNCCCRLKVMYWRFVHCCRQKSGPARLHSLHSIQLHLYPPVSISSLLRKPLKCTLKLYRSCSCEKLDHPHPTPKGKTSCTETRALLCLLTPHRLYTGVQTISTATISGIYP